MSTAAEISGEGAKNRTCCLSSPPVAHSLVFRCLERYDDEEKAHCGVKGWPIAVHLLVNVICCKVHEDARAARRDVCTSILI